LKKEFVNYGQLNLINIMSYIILRTMNDQFVQSRKNILSEAVARAEELIEDGIERNLLICQEVDNSEAKKLDWSQSSYKRIFVCNVS
jgi:hypothetical protein